MNSKESLKAEADRLVVEAKNEAKMWDDFFRKPKNKNIKKAKAIPMFIWKCIWVIPAVLIRILFCLIVGIFDLSIESAIYAWDQTG